MYRTIILALIIISCSTNIVDTDTDQPNVYLGYYNGDTVYFKDTIIDGDSVRVQIWLDETFN